MKTKEAIIKVFKSYECSPYMGSDINYLKESDYEDAAKDIIEILQKPVVKENITSEWISVEDRKLIATEKGEWDGLRSSQILVEDKDNVYDVAVKYEGTIDGSYFCDFYDRFDIEIKNVIIWKYIN